MNKILRIIIFMIFFSVSCTAQNNFQNFASFNGTSTYFATPNGADINPASAVTIEFWMNIPSAPAATQYIIAKNNATGWSVGINSARKIVFKATSIFTLTSAAAIPLNTWTHIAVTYSQIGSGVIYINGVQNAASSGSAMVINQNTDSLYIGCDRQSGTPAFFYNGQLDAVRIWKDKQRAASEIKETMFLEFTGNNNALYPNLYSNLTFASDFNKLTTDICGTTQSLIARGGVTTQPYTRFPLSHIDYNSNIYLNGAGCLASFNNSDYNATTGITIEAWIRRDTIGGEASQAIAVKSALGGTRVDWGLGVTNTGAVFFILNNNSAALTTSNLITNKQWHHVAATYSTAAGFMKVYIDGDSVASMPFSQPINSNNDSVYIGAVNGFGAPGLFFKGQMDELRIWKNIARTTEEIRSSMYRSFTPDDNHPAGLREYSFDNYTTSGTTGTNSNFIGALSFIGDVKVVSSHFNNDTLSTSPLLRDDNNGFHSTNYFIKRKGFFIPDAGSVTDSVTVPASGGVISKLRVFLALTHPFLGDLSVSLKSPQGTVVPLLTGSSTGSNDIITIFDDDADSTFSSSPSMAPYSPKVKAINQLSAFNNQTASGNWKLIVSDGKAELKGYVIAWGIQPTLITGIENNTGTEIPQDYYLKQNYPNPFNPQTKISFGMPEAGMVKITVFDITGKAIITLVNEFKKAGNYETSFKGQSLSSGMYFYKIEAGHFTAVKKMILIK